MREQKRANAEFTSLEWEKVKSKRRQNAETWRQIESGQIQEIPEWSNRPLLTPIYPNWVELESQVSAVFPLSSLAPLALGQIDIYPQAYKAVSSGRFSYNKTEPSVEQAENPLKMLIGNFDLAFVVVYLLPLFILALSFNLISSEKESGVLGLLLSQPISLRTLLLAKITLRVVLIFGAILSFILLSIFIAGVDGSEPGAISKLILWLFVDTIYGAFWFALALVVNALGKTSAANAVILASFWLLLVLLIPAASAFVAKRIYRSPHAPNLTMRNEKQ